VLTEVAQLEELIGAASTGAGAAGIRAAEASAARRRAPVRRPRSPSSARAVVARRGGSGDAVALALGGTPWRRPHQVSLGVVVPCVSS